MKRILSVFISAVLAVTAVLLGYPVTGNAADSGNIFDDASRTEYHIATVQDLLDFNASSLDFQGKTVYLDADIDMKGIEWKPRDFYGYFDGQYHTIKNVSTKYYENSRIELVGQYSYDKYLSGGLFIMNYGIITRLNFIDYSVTGHTEYWQEELEEGVMGLYCRPAYVGGICCVNQGMIYGCMADGTYNADTDGSLDFPIPNDIVTGNICAADLGKIEYCTDGKEDSDWTHEDVDQIDFSSLCPSVGLLVVSPDPIHTYEECSDYIYAEINGQPVDASFYSDNTDVALVSGSDYDYSYHYIKGISAGKTRIKVQFGDQVRYVDVHVSEMGELVVSPETVTIFEGESQELNITMNNEPINASCVVTDSEIATV